MTKATTTMIDAAALIAAICTVVGLYMSNLMITGETELGWSEDDIPRSPP